MSLKFIDIKNGLLLGLSTTVAVFVIVAAFKLTQKPILLTEQENLQTALLQLLAPDSFNNEPALDTLFLSDPALGSTEPRAIYRARNSGTPTGAVITSVAPDGYNGDIELLVGLSYQGDIIGVRVTSHNETPGLGDDIDTRKSDWIYAFDNLVVDEIEPEQWTVKKDGGRFDQFTGATITPRAIVSAVHQVALWYRQNRETVFRQPTTEAQFEHDKVQSKDAQSHGNNKPFSDNIK